VRGCLVPVDRLASLCDPRRTPPWSCARFTETDVRQAVAKRRVRPTPVEDDQDARQHIERIAYLAIQGWDDPVEVDVGCPVLGYWGPRWPLLDGNHRFYAALIRGDKEILLSVEGQLDHAAQLFGVQAEDLAND